MSAGAPEPPPVRITTLPDGYAGTAVVVATMSRFALEALKDERVNQLARRITAHLPARETAAEAAALLRYLQEGFRYTDLPWHPAGWQRLQTPAYTLFDAPVRSGECASLSTALAALGMSLGHQILFRTAGRDPSRPYEFEHVYCVTWLDGRGWTPSDPSFPEPLGWQSPLAAVWQDWRIE